jgi:3-deoxy-alpha-D-manno-octulosonate 8-oxidase
MRNSKNVQNYIFGRGSFQNLSEILEPRRKNDEAVVFIVDHFFKTNLQLPVHPNDFVLHVDTRDEPTTEQVDEILGKAKESVPSPCAIVGIGGGSVLDIAKAVSNLFRNPGKAEDYQGWDLIKSPGVYKIAVPTISGTGAEASRTCVMVNHKKNLKLGMNSEHTIYDQLILDPELTITVPRDQYFYTGMDSYIHCVESVAGSYRNAIGDAFSEQSLKLCRDVFLSDDMQAFENREKLMIASYLGGCAIANSFVGVVHPFSAGLSMVFGTHHCLANCIVMNSMEDYYPSETIEFHKMLSRQKIELPKIVSRPLTASEKKDLYNATVIHEKPLTNALGPDYKKHLTEERVSQLFEKMLGV